MCAGRTQEEPRARYRTGSTVMEGRPSVCSGTDSALEALSINSIIALLHQDHRPTCFSIHLHCNLRCCTWLHIQGEMVSLGHLVAESHSAVCILRGSGRKINHNLSFEDETFLFPSDSKGIGLLLCSKSWMDFCCCCCC